MIEFENIAAAKWIKCGFPKVPWEEGDIYLCFGVTQLGSLKPSGQVEGKVERGVSDMVEYITVSRTEMRKFIVSEKEHLSKTFFPSMNLEIIGVFFCRPFKHFQACNLDFGL